MIKRTHNINNILWNLRLDFQSTERAKKYNSGVGGVIIYVRDQLQRTAILTSQHFAHIEHIY